MAFSPRDGGLLATCDAAGSASLWQLGGRILLPAVDEANILQTFNQAGKQDQVD